MKITPVLLLALAGVLPVRAQQDDPLKSAACGTALADLQAARTGGAGAGQVEALRSTAAGVCLGSATLPTRPARVVQPPVVVPPPQVEVPQRVAPLPPPVLPPPPVAIERAPLPAQCGPGGCWTDDGSHLRHVPPSLVAPGGLCIQQGGGVYCP